MHIKVFTNTKMMCNAYDDMAYFRVQNTIGVTFSSGMVWGDTPGHRPMCSMLTAGGGWTASWSVSGWASPTWSANFPLWSSW